MVTAGTEKGTLAVSDGFVLLFSDTTAILGMTFRKLLDLFSYVLDKRPVVKLQCMLHVRQMFESPEAR